MKIGVRALRPLEAPIPVPLRPLLFAAVSSAFSKLKSGLFTFDE
jgi:hypothetical protein